MYAIAAGSVLLMTFSLSASVSEESFAPDVSYEDRFLNMRKHLRYTLSPNHQYAPIERYKKGDACIGGKIEVTSVPNNLPVNRIYCNVTYKIEDFALRPNIKFPTANKRDSYTVMMLDADWPNLEFDNHYLHWLVSNINGSDLRNGDLESGLVLAEYIPPNPQPGTGPHRYEFLVYVQVNYPTDKIANIPIKDEERHTFNYLRFKAVHNELTILVGPLTGTQMLLKHGY